MTHSKLYHEKLGIPKEFKTRFGRIPLTYTFHACDRAFEKAGREFAVPNYLDTNTARVIEVEVVDGVPIKVVYRTALNNREDICLAVLLHSWRVKTIWLNDTNDDHSTLKEWRYVKPKEIGFRQIP